jgi:hypothetical protein
VVTTQQMNDLGSYNRNFMYMMRTIPGVTGVGDRTMNVNGMRIDAVSFKLDGVVNNDYGDNACCNTYVNMDMIQEIKLVSNSATADMGSNGSAHVIVVTKGGSKEYHGNAYFFKRAEFMNANTWTNNRTGAQRGRDRMNQGGFTIGGPLWAGKFNKNRDKLFFFVSDELWKNYTPSLTTHWVPTALERAGDFSQSVQSSDKTAVTILDPLNSRTAFPGNIVPANRLSADGQKLLSIIPLPNASSSGSSGNFNYQRQNSPGYYDRLLQSYRIDYNVNDKWRIYARYSHDYQEIGDPLGMASFELDPSGKTLGWNLQFRPTFSGTVNVTTIVSARATNEFIFGASRAKDNHVIDRGSYTRDKLGLNFSLPHPDVNVGNYGPYVNFGGSGMSGYATQLRLGSNVPYIAFSPDFTLTDNFTLVLSKHLIKAGIFFDLNRKDQDVWGGLPHGGQFNFNRDSLNPGDTDNQYANMVTGAFQTFQQNDQRHEGRYVWHQWEWYIADTWKPKPGLTIDYGMRFYSMQPGYDSKMQIATFAPSLWDPTKVVSLYSRAPIVGKTLTINPLTGSTVPNYLYGAIVQGSGDINNGFALAGTRGVPQGLIPGRGVGLAPRLGVAWVPKFLTKTVVRFGSGISYDRNQGNITYNSLNFPPTRRDITLQYGYISDINSAQGTVMTPVGVTGGYIGSGKVPLTLNWNFSVERELPYSTLMTVGYVGSISRHLVFGLPINDVPWGAAWRADTQDPSKTPLYDGTTTLPINFYRPYKGVGQLDLYSSLGSANYNALQISVNKRMSRRLSYGVAYTWSKSLGLGTEIWNSVNSFDARKYGYQRVGYDRTQIMTANFILNLPKPGSHGNFLDHRLTRMAFNDWKLSGLVTAQTGTPVSFTYYINGVSSLQRSYTGNERYGPRPRFVSDWRLPSSQQTDFAAFNTASIIPASKPSVGLDAGLGYNSNPRTFLSSPELILFKEFPFSETNRQRYVQFRLETYNTFNHHDYNYLATNAGFRSATDFTLVNLPTGMSANGDGGRFGFGAKNGANSPRRLQLSLKIYF